jgi:hypothetical protein
MTPEIDLLYKYLVDAFFSLRIDKENFTWKTFLGKKLIPASNDASWAKLPRMDAISVLQAQFFDNRAQAEGTKGKSPFALKLFAWTAGWDIDLKQVEWWRVVQLIDPKTVLSWANKMKAAGEMDDAMFSTYETVAVSAIEASKTDEYEFVKMGHIASPPGKQYFVGQFVYIHKTKDGEFGGFIYNDGDTIDLGALKPTKKRGTYRKPGSPTHAAILRGNELLERQRVAAKALADRVASKPKAEKCAEEDEFARLGRDFMGRNPF